MNEIDAMAYIELLISNKLLPVEASLGSALEKGVLTKATSEKLVLKSSDEQVKIVFGGEYETDPDVTGTMIDFKLIVNGTKVYQGGGFEVSAEELVEKFETPNAAEDILNLLLPQVAVFNGSKSGDMLAGLDLDGLVAKGRGGDDTLIGGEGQQKLKGGSGNDLLIGSDGGGGKAKTADPTFDKLYGGKGLDTFQFEVSGGNISAAKEAYHKIKDFSHKDDTILLIGPDLGPGFLDPDAFVVGEEATTADHSVVYDKPNGVLYFDGDGVDGDSQMKFAEVDPGTKIKANDFVIEGLLEL